MEEFNDKQQFSVSVIVPIYNGEKTIEKTIQCLLKQSLKSLEIILINDGSVDETDRICEKYKNNYTNIIYIATANKGVSAARNRGLECAKGEYIGFLDADDIVPTNYFAYLYELALKYDAEMAIVDKLVVKDTDSIPTSIDGNYSTYIMNSEEANRELLYDRINESVYTKLYKATICKEVRFVEGKKINEDKYFVFQSIINSKCIVYQNIKLYIQWKNPDSVTRSGFSKKQFDYIYFAKEMELYALNYCPSLSEAAKYNRLDRYLLLLILGKKGHAIEQFPKEFKEIKLALKNYSLTYVLKNFSFNRSIVFISERYSLPIYDLYLKLCEIKRGLV